MSNRQARSWASQDQAGLDAYRAATGLPADWRERAARTPHADDAAFLQADREAAQEWRQRRARHYLARLPEVYREAVPRRPETRDWLNRYRTGERRPLVFMGDVGTGKTWEAMAIARSLLSDSIPVTVVTAPELAQALRPSGSSEVSDAGQFQAAPVLVLDDLGTEKLTDWVVEQLYMVASFRAARMYPTVVTTNLKPDDLRARYEERLIQRLFGGGVSVIMRGESLRKLPF